MVKVKPLKFIPQNDCWLTNLSDAKNLVPPVNIHQSACGYCKGTHLEIFMATNATNKQVITGPTGGLSKVCLARKIFGNFAKDRRNHVAGTT